MGGFTILSGFILAFCLPDSFKRPHSTFAPKWDMFTEREIYILNKRVRLDDPAKGRKKKSIGKAAFKKTVSLSDLGYSQRSQLICSTVQQLENVGTSSDYPV